MGKPKKKSNIPIETTLPKNCWVVTHLLQDKVLKTVVRADLYNVEDNMLEFEDEETGFSTALIKNWMILEKVSPSEADMIEIEQLVDHDQPHEKKNLNELITGRS